MRKLLKMLKDLDGYLAAISILVLIFGNGISYFLGISLIKSTVLTIVILTVFAVVYVLLVAIPSAVRESNAREHGRNPEIRVLEETIHMTFLRHASVEYFRSFVILPTGDGVGSFRVKLSWQGDPSLISIKSSNGCKTRIEDDPEDTGIAIIAHFDTSLIRSQEFSFSYTLKFDNSLRQIKQFLAHTAPYKPERNLKLKVTLTKTPVKFFKTEYKSADSEHVNGKKEEFTTYPYCEWDIPEPDFNIDYRMTWEY